MIYCKILSHSSAPNYYNPKVSWYFLWKNNSGLIPALDLSLKGFLLFLKCVLVCTRMGHLTTDTSSQRSSQISNSNYISHLYVRDNCLATLFTCFSKNGIKTHMKWLQNYALLDSMILVFCLSTNENNTVIINNYNSK